MSSVALSTIPLRRPASNLRAYLESSLGEHHASTLLLRERDAPHTVPTGIAALDRLTGGLPRGALSEVTGPPSSGRTGVMLSTLAAATRRQEVCALIDAGDSFDPASAATTGVDLERLLWVRCTQPAGERKRDLPAAKSRQSAFAFGHALEQVLKVTDLLLQSGGFGMVVLDLGDISVDSARRVPLTSWFRFRRAVEPTATVLLLIEQEPHARTCASLVLRLQPEALVASDAQGVDSNSNSYNVGCSAREMHISGINREFSSHNVGCSNSEITIPEPNSVSHADLLRGMRFRAEVVRSWAQPKPPQSAAANVELRTAM